MSEKPVEQEDSLINNTSMKDGDSIFEQYQRIQVNEHHFNNIQAGVRKLASIWLLAAFGAIAYTIRESMSSALIDARILASIVGFMGAVGLLLLLILDLVVYHRLLNAVFLLGLRMEYRYRTLPPIRTMMMLYSQKRGMARYMKLYYLVPMSAFAVISLFSAIWYLCEVGTLSFSAFVPLIIAVIAAAMPFLGAYMTRGEAAEYKEISQGFEDEEFNDYLAKEKYKEILQGH